MGGGGGERAGGRGVTLRRQMDEEAKREKDVD